MMTIDQDMSGAVRRRRFEADGRAFACIDLQHALSDDLLRLPHVLRILLENALRNSADEAQRIVPAVRDWLSTRTSVAEIPFLPNRLMMHDTTCGPALLDIAAMRDVLAEHGRDPDLLMPRIGVDVSTDHSSGVDFHAPPMRCGSVWRRSSSATPSATA